MAYAPGGIRKLKKFPLLIAGLATFRCIEGMKPAFAHKAVNLAGGYSENLSRACLVVNGHTLENRRKDGTTASLVMLTKVATTFLRQTETTAWREGSAPILDALRTTAPVL